RAGVAAVTDPVVILVVEGVEGADVADVADAVAVAVDRAAEREGAAPVHLVLHDLAGVARGPRPHASPAPADVAGVGQAAVDDDAPADPALEEERVAVAGVREEGRVRGVAGVWVLVVREPIAPGRVAESDEDRMGRIREVSIGRAAGRPRGRPAGDVGLHGGAAAV